MMDMTKNTAQHACRFSSVMQTSSILVYIFFVATIITTSHFAETTRCARSAKFVNVHSLVGLQPRLLYVESGNGSTHAAFTVHECGR
jgi:hypothetical protein